MSDERRSVAERFLAYVRTRRRLLLGFVAVIGVGLAAPFACEAFGLSFRSVLTVVLVVTALGAGVQLVRTLRTRSHEVAQGLSSRFGIVWIFTSFATFAALSASSSVERFQDELMHVTWPYLAWNVAMAVANFVVMQRERSLAPRH